MPHEYGRKERRFLSLGQLWLSYQQLRLETHDKVLILELLVYKVVFDLPA